MRRYAIYGVFIVLFAPGCLVLMAGAMLITAVVASQVLRGGLSTILYMWPVVGGTVGLASACILTANLAGRPINTRTVWLAIVGLLVGVATEGAVYFYFAPQFPALEPTLVFWLPPMVGALLLLVGTLGLRFRSASAC